MATKSTSFNESSTNQTADSKLAGAFDTGQGLIKELSFFQCISRMILCFYLSLKYKIHSFLVILCVIFIINEHLNFEFQLWLQNKKEII